MNIIEKVREILQSFPKISEICNEIHVDFADPEPTSYGLSSIGDSLVREDVLGNQTRQHTFILYSTFSAYNDYERLSNSTALLELSHWLHTQTDQEVESKIGEGLFSTVLRTCPHKKFRTSFRQILPIAVLKKLTIRQYVFAFSPCPRQNYARKSAHNFYVDRFSASAGRNQKEKSSKSTNRNSSSRTRSLSSCGLPRNRRLLMKLRSFLKRLFKIFIAYDRKKY